MRAQPGLGVGGSALDRGASLSCGCRAVVGLVPFSPVSSVILHKSGTQPSSVRSPFQTFTLWFHVLSPTPATCQTPKLFLFSLLRDTSLETVALCSLSGYFLYLQSLPFPCAMGQSEASVCKR